MQASSRFAVPQRSGPFECIKRIEHVERTAQRRRGSPGRRCHQVGASGRVAEMAAKIESCPIKRRGAFRRCPWNFVGISAPAAGPCRATAASATAPNKVAPGHVLFVGTASPAKRARKSKTLQVHVSDFSFMTTRRGFVARGPCLTVWPGPMMHRLQCAPDTTFHVKGARSMPGRSVLVPSVVKAARFGRGRDVLLRRRFGLPSRRRNCRFEAESADDFLDLGVNPM
jgi:hypothetical protein